MDLKVRYLYEPNHWHLLSTLPAFTTVFGS